MPGSILIADSGSTKAEWCLITNGRKRTFFTRGISPYFLNTEQIGQLIETELLPGLKNVIIADLFYYGTGCLDPKNAKSVKDALKTLFPKAHIDVGTDLLGAAKAVCGNNKGIACILGTGSNSCYYNGKKVVKNKPRSLGYILGDEGSGAYLGKRLLQYYLYETFDEELKSKFDARFTTTREDILDNVYKKPLANRYLAGFTIFLAENRGHFMIENILEDGLNDFFFHHLCKYREVWTMPVSFVGSVAYGFKDVLEQLCESYEFELGKVLKSPMQGLVKYHQHKYK
jgi:N-acetylglucosamine kinase-like BadF-type ATPase